MPVWNDVAVPAVFRQTVPEFPVSISNSDRIATRYAVAIASPPLFPHYRSLTLAAKDPGTAIPLEHSPLLTQYRLCGIDRLDPQAIRDTSRG